MADTKTVIEELIVSIQDTMELFYQQKLQEALDAFNNLIGKIMEGMDLLFAYRDENEGFDIDERKLTTSLKDALAAMEEKDYVLLADILQYDFVEYLQHLVVQMG